MIVTANTFFNRLKGWDDFRLQFVIPAMQKRGVDEQGYDNESPPMKAYVNHGRWLVKCECNGAEKVWEEGWVMCISCFNGRHKHRYRRTVFPRARKKIEALLEKRPIPNRNWYPGETLADLQRENEEHKEELL